MEFSTHAQISALRDYEEEQKLKKNFSFQRAKIPKGNVNHDETHEKDETNIFLDRSVRSLFDSFVLTWHLILLDFLNPQTFQLNDTEMEGEWWDILRIYLQKLIAVLWKKDRIFHVGVGFVIISFFVYFILVAA